MLWLNHCLEKLHLLRIFCEPFCCFRSLRLCYKLFLATVNHFWKTALLEVFLDSFLPVGTILLGRFWKVFVSQRQFRKTSNSFWVSFPRRQNILEPKSSLTDKHKDLVSLRDVGHSANIVQKQCSFFSLGKCVLPSTFASR